MKRNLLGSLVMLALGSLHAAPEGGGEPIKEHKPLVNIPENVQSWHEAGKKEGTKVHEAIERGEMLARDVALVYGEHLGIADASGNGLQPSANDFLSGYASAWSNPNTAKARKTEMKAVFDAWAMRDEEREMVVGYTKPEKGSKESPSPIKETHTIGDWLKQHADLPGYSGFSGLIGLAKMLRGPASGKGAGGGANRGPRTVTDKQQDEILGRVEVMNANQAHAVASRATAQLAKLPQFEVVMFRQITNACDQILNKSTDEACKKRADAIRNMAEDMIEKLRAADKAFNAQTTPKISSPTPAPQPQAASEQGGPAPAQQEQKAA